MSRLYNNVLKGATAAAREAEKRPTITRKPPPLTTDKPKKKKKKKDKAKTAEYIRSRDAGTVRTLPFTVPTTKNKSYSM